MNTFNRKLAADALARKKRLDALRKRGLNDREIAEIEGVSRARVQKILGAKKK